MSYDAYGHPTGSSSHPASTDPYASETVLAGPGPGSQQPTFPSPYQPSAYAPPGPYPAPGPAPYAPPPVSQPASYAASYGPASPQPGPYSQPTYGVQPYGSPLVPRPQETEKLALAAFICGLVGLVFGWLVGALAIAGVVGLILGIIALGHFRAEPTRYNNKWMAVVGIVTGVLATLAMLLSIVAMVILMMTNPH